jgi:hypothetical protein
MTRGFNELLIEGAVALEFAIGHLYLYQQFAFESGCNQPWGVRSFRLQKSELRMNVFLPRALPAALLLAAITCTGCGTPGTPLPPSLKLPDPVVDLSAARTGNQVALAWTMPKKTTDKLRIKGAVGVRICRKEGSGACVPMSGELSLAPGEHGTFTETLPTALATGPARPLAYQIELTNAKGRSDGPSNAAVALAGEAPGPVAGLNAQIRKNGLILRWSEEGSSPQGSSTTAIRLRRKLLTPETNSRSKSSAQGLLAAPKEPIEQNLMVEPAANGMSSDRALDKTIRFGATYEYQAQRVARVLVGDKTFELDGPLSDPIRIEAQDTFPPSVPSGLAAVATAADSNAGPSIDLNWQPVTDPDLAGYAVYRRDANQPDAAWQRVSPAAPVIGPGFHDPQVQPGHTYRYAVTAIDQLGHESARSAEAEETVQSQ